MRRPRFSDLSPEEQRRFGNGLGPWWLPERARAFLTETMSWFFEEASWRHHDFGYAVGGDRFDRARCDWKFLRAMLRDGMSQRLWPAIPLALTLSVIFYLAVRLGGAASFTYQDHYSALEDLSKPPAPGS